MSQIQHEQSDVFDGLSSIAQLIDEGQFAQAREALEGQANAAADELELMRLKLQVAQQSLEPSRALQAVLAILRNDPHQPTALALYREFSLLQYQAGRSCLSHSHPPPAVS